LPRPPPGGPRVLAPCGGPRADLAQPGGGEVPLSPDGRAGRPSAQRLTASRHPLSRSRVDTGRLLWVRHKRLGRGAAFRCSRAETALDACVRFTAERGTSAASHAPACCKRLSSSHPANARAVGIGHQQPRTPGGLTYSRRHQSGSRLAMTRLPRRWRDAGPVRSEPRDLAPHESEAGDPFGFGGLTIPAVAQEQGVRIDGAALSMEVEVAGPADGEERGRAGFRQETPRRIEAGPQAGASASGHAYASLSESRCFGATVASIDASTAPRASQMASCGEGPI
jgi:hypothetical protein